jgi:hypothetical protein
MRYGIRIALVCAGITLTTFGTRFVSYAQQSHDSSYQEMSDKFFSLLQQDKASDGVDYLFATNPALTKMQDEAANIKGQFGTVRTLMGDYVSHTKLVETKVAGVFVYQHYFVAYERQPISVRIEYYKSGATWMCSGLQFDAKVTDEIQKAADANLSFPTK